MSSLNPVEALRELVPKNKKEWLSMAAIYAPFIVWYMAINLTKQENGRIVEIICGAPIVLFGSLAVGILTAKKLGIH